MTEYLITGSARASTESHFVTSYGTSAILIYKICTCAAEPEVVPFFLTYCKCWQTHMYTAPRLHSSQYTHIWSATQPCRQSNLILQQTKYLEYSTHLVRRYDQEWSVRTKSTICMPDACGDAWLCRHSVASNHKGSTPPTKAMSDVSAKQRNDEPYDVKEEAQLLTEFAEIPGISSALIGPATSEGQQITVRSL